MNVTSGGKSVRKRCRDLSRRIEGKQAVSTNGVSIVRMPQSSSTSGRSVERGLMLEVVQGEERFLDGLEVGAGRRDRKLASSEYSDRF
jgi:hypothetical protein